MKQKREQVNDEIESKATPETFAKTASENDLQCEHKTLKSKLKSKIEPVEKLGIDLVRLKKKFIASSQTSCKHIVEELTQFKLEYKENDAKYKKKTKC